jgi:preprotein translocase subunit SecD
VPLLILVIGVLALYINLMPGSSGPGSGAQFISLSNPNAGIAQVPDTKLGLDLQGGFSVTYKTVVAPGQDPASSDQMAVIRGIIENRVNTTGVSEPVVETAGTDEIIVQVPGAANEKQITDLVGHAGKLEFVLLPSADYGKFDPTTNALVPGTKTIPTQGQPIDPSLPVQFTGSQLDSGAIAAAVDTNHPGFWMLKFGFAGDAAGQFSTWSGQHIDEYFAIVLDGTVESSPYIASQITGGSGQITGNFSKSDAQSLEVILQSGALPYPLEQISKENIPASLGRTFLDQTLFAGAVGIGLVMIFMLIYYRLPGLMACIALMYYGLTVYAIFRIIPATLTLAGIAGFVLSVGMAVDANILIFERTKEELRSGKTLVTAIEAGFNRAWNSILDSNVSSLITAGILYMGGSPAIKGFALVLMIGVATSMFTAVTVSRTLLRFVVHQQMAQKAWLFGVTNEEFQARAMGARLPRREVRGRV